LLAFPFAVFQKFGNDQAGGKAAMIAYYGLFALFPLLLLFTTILGFLLANDPDFQKKVIDSALGNFPIIGEQLKSADHPLTGTATAVTIGVLGTLYGAQGVGQAALNAMHTVWNIPYAAWPNFWLRRLRGFAILAALGAGTLLATALVGFGPSIFHGNFVEVWSIAVSVIVNFAVFTASFVLLTSEPLGWRDVAVGAGLATAFWVTLQALGGWYVQRVLAHATPTYGFFAIVIGLLSWMYLGAQLTLLAAEINVVRRYRLWPRSITQPPLTDGDRRTFERLARMEQRRPETEVVLKFRREADHQPREGS
jgi:YihY family inner membrane protein